MGAVTDERELVGKLILTGHLSVPERKALPSRAAKASLIRSMIEGVLRSDSPLLAWWMPDDSMAGCVIEYRGLPDGRVEWRYRGIDGERVAVLEFNTAAQAAEHVLTEARPFLGQAIDGVPIDWAT